MIVLIADIYHRAIMLPRLKHEVEMRERERQLEAERIAAGRAGEVLNSMAGGLSNSADMGGQQQQPSLDEQTHTSAPNRLEAPKSPQIGNRALNAVLTALSNYNDEDNEEINAINGWGVESEVEGTRSWDRPIVLHGSDGILTKHRHHQAHSNEEDGMEQFHSPYRVMEDLDAIDRICIQEGSGGRPAYNWIGAFYDSKQELIAHFRDSWRDIIDDEESNRLEKFLLVCEFPVTVFRKVCLLLLSRYRVEVCSLTNLIIVLQFTIAIPCEGSYCRPLVALALAFSPLWFGFYLHMQFDIDLWDIRMVIFLSIMSILGILVIRYAPGGDGTMAAYISVPVALFGFVVAATWIGKFFPCA
jgi:sodium/potassium/calcium exchanger 6